MAVIIFIVVLIIIIVSINSYNHKRNQELIETVTSLDRGTNSERFEREPTRGAL